MNRFRSFALLAIVVTIIAPTIQAAPIFISDFSTFTDGALVGQGGWAQAGTSVLAPLTVTSGKVVVPAVTGTTSVDNQDAFKSVGASAIPAPGAGTTSVYFGVDLSVQSAPPSSAGPSYFLAMDVAADATGFDNFRIAARAIDAGFVFGARITGQGTDPYNYGTTVLSFNTTYRLVGKLDMVAGLGNDVLTLYVDPSSDPLSGQTPHLVHVIGAGATDPTGIGAFLISQFHSSGSQSAAYTIGKTIMSMDASDVVPEPSGLALAGLVLAFISTKRRMS